MEKNIITKDKVVIIGKSPVRVNIKIASHGHWDNVLSIEGEYEDVKEEVKQFYDNAALSIQKVIEKEIAYHDGVAKHFRK